MKERAPHKPKDYTAYFDTVTFMADVNAERLRLDWDWRQVADAINVPRSTLSHLFVRRIDSPGAHIMVSLLHWLGRTDIQRYMVIGKRPAKATDE